MHGHDPYLVAPAILLAFHLRAFKLQRRNESLQAGQAGCFMVQRKGQELVENIAGLGAEPPKKFSTPAILSQNPRIKIMRAEQPGEGKQML
ncbi:hypothetical protein D3C80_1011670 [compost metagenome]